MSPPATPTPPQHNSLRPLTQRRRHVSISSNTSGTAIGLSPTPSPSQKTSPVSPLITSPLPAAASKTAPSPARAIATRPSHRTDGTKGTITVDVDAGVATDASGNSNTAATHASQKFDKRVNLQLSDIAAGEGGFLVEGGEFGDVAHAGDVNGDGLSDLIFAGMSHKVYVVYGKTDNEKVKINDLEAGNGGFAIQGETNQYEGYFTEVSTAGDVNADGLADLIIGQGLYDVNPGDRYDNHGRSYVVFGKTDNTKIQLTDIVAGNGGPVIHGQSEMAASGYSVAPAGDINNDGLVDLVIGSPGANGRGYWAGTAHVVYAKLDDTTAVQLNDGGIQGGRRVAAGRRRGNYSNESTGRKVVGAGDFNGDGKADLAIAEPNLYGEDNSYHTGMRVPTSDAGAVRIVDGQNISKTLLRKEHKQSVRLGTEMSPAGDFNGDGYADILINHAGFNYFYRTSSEYRNERGRLYIVGDKPKIKNISLIMSRSGCTGTPTKRRAEKLSTLLSLTKATFPDSPNPRSNDPQLCRRHRKRRWPFRHTDPAVYEQRWSIKLSLVRKQWPCE